MLSGYYTITAYADKYWDTTKIEYLTEISKKRTKLIFKIKHLFLKNE
jgi:hypothetical protein